MVKPSRLLMGGLLFFHLAALGSLFSLLSLSWWLPATLLLLFSLGYQRFRTQRVVRFDYAGAGGSCVIELKTGEVLSVELLQERFVTRWLIILHGRLESGRRLSLLLLPDSADPEGLRQLRWRLKLPPRHESN